MAEMGNEGAGFFPERDMEVVEERRNLGEL